MLALVFNISNAVGFTYAYVPSLRIPPLIHASDLSPSPNLTRSHTSYLHRDRDAKQKWANQLGGGWGGIGGLGTQVLAGVVKNSVGRVFR